MQNYEKLPNVSPAASLPPPPPYSEKQPPCCEGDVAGGFLTQPAEPAAAAAPAVGFFSTPSTPPPPYQPLHDGPYGPGGVGPGPAGAPIYHAPPPQQQQGLFAASTSSPPTNVKDYLGYSIFSMLCCCLPLGIAALVYSVKTRDANQIGNLTAAEHYSEKARTYGHAATAVGLVFLILYIVLKFVLAGYVVHRY